VFSVVVLKRGFSVTLIYCMYNLKTSNFLLLGLDLIRRGELFVCLWTCNNKKKTFHCYLFISREQMCGYWINCRWLQFFIANPFAICSWGPQSRKPSVIAVGESESVSIIVGYGAKRYGLRVA
jgi:hypothetical protein